MGAIGSIDRSQPPIWLVFKNHKEAAYSRKIDDSYQTIQSTCNDDGLAIDLNNDPFDLLLIAQSQIEKLPIIIADKKISLT